MIADFFAWLPGPLAYDIFAIVGTVAISALLGWVLATGASLLADWRRSTRSIRPFGEAAPVLAVPAEATVVEPRSPFRRKREAK